MRIWNLPAVAILLAAPVLSMAAEVAEWPDRSVLPISLSPFKGKIGKDYTQTKDDWQQVPTAPEGAPNVLVVLLDDVGFGQTSTFGGLIPTPNLDKLASEGLKFNRFHTTAICGPSRAALLTGRNHHDTGNGFLMEWATGLPNYNTMIQRDTATIGEILKDNGYSTSWLGKNHNTPDWESSVAGPFDRWPTGLGFEYFFGFNAGETNQYYPTIFENTKAVNPDKSPEEGYHFMTDITDRAIARVRYSKSVAPNKPFFMYFAPGAMHAPHQVSKEWRDKFKGKFDMGWDKYREVVYQQQLDMGIIPKGTKLTPRPEWVPAWDSLSADQKKLYTRLMENYAGFFAFADHEIGRLLDSIKQLPDADNTMVIYIAGDNGASAEGGPDGTVNEIKALNGQPTTIEETLKRYDEIGGPNTEPHYPVGWAWAGNTPFQWVKQVASHLGGTRNPMVVSWPAKIKPDTHPRDQFLHLVDIVPTILEAAHLPMPTKVKGVEQKPLAGASFLSAFTDAKAPSPRDEQYFEVLSNRSVYSKGWKADAQHTLPWRQDLAPGNWDKDKWELYNLNEDFSEANDLAAQMPEKVEEMKKKFDELATKYNVYPLDDRGAARLAVPKPGVPGSDPKAKRYTYYAGATHLPETAAPQMKNRSWTLTAGIKTEGSKTSGVVMAFGGVAAGISIYLDKGVPVFHYNWFEENRYIIKGDKPLPAGESTLKVDFVYDGGGAGKGGMATISVDGKKVAEGRVDKTVAGRFGIDTFGIGEDSAQPVVNTYKPPFPFEGEIEKVVIDLK
ncbi:sulfatase-like hydrolase/transferase [Pseudomonas segetis]|uniref:Arylsulfatase n=1 Tax=Pseudomonas segetis TaxID=298908 RepID=A0A239JDH0_9PSED|nr:sulfatase-like hydrolase/transferase [Pseudomonas segetis]SNT03652.1 arylsulfatase [Pseudomonas segetis]